MTDNKPKRKPRSNYSDEIWFCVRTVYEADGESTVERIVEIVGEFLGETKLPNRRTVVTRAEKEGWERPQNISQKTNAQLYKLMKKARNSLDTATIEDKKNTINQDDTGFLTDKDLYVSRRNEIVSQALSGVKKLLSTTSRRKLKIADVIRRNRNMNDQLQHLTMHIIDEIVINKTLMLDRTFQAEAEPEDKELIEKSYGMALGLGEPIMFLTNALEKQAKMDILFYGITSEDTREPETAGRLTDLNDDTAYEQQMLELKQRNIEMMERRVMLESGDFEREIEEEQQRQMQEMGLLDDDISEAEYEDIENDV
ncbi:hypothetical protein [Acinetobacter sp. CFCC 10889]|uniref:hypothetical protein n=1 Tax=Acinetobacter sp. CFCC 10889 TaxID=1775557 RepID=UPI000DD0D4FB|nr:hypothetical protein [Acinetobacter sp. CFCC 10889]